MIAIWILVIAVYHGGIIAVPQASREECLSNVAWIKTNSVTANPGGFDMAVYCIPGVK